MKQIKQETGRSMVEMLGVLAIIGVLSVGGIAAYKNAMNRHEANSIRNEVNRRVVVWASDNAFGRDFYPFNKNALGYQWQDPENKGDFIQFEVSGIEAEVCDKVKSNDWKMVYVNENCTIFAFKNDLTQFVPQKTCSECNEECGECDALTGKCEPHDELCPSDKPYCGANGTCDSCVGLTSAYGAKQGQCLSCEDLENNTSYAKGDCRRCSNWISSGNGYCRPCNYYNYIAYSSYEDVLKCPHRVYKTYYSGRNNWYCNPEYSLLNEDQTDCTKIKDCPEGRYWMAGNCYPCSYSEPWYSLKEEEAKRCVGQIYLNGKNSYSWCGAEGAVVSTYTNCYSCDTPVRYWNEQDEKCYLACPEGTVANEITRKCLPAS